MKARENPFRAERIESLSFRFDDGDVDSLLSRFADTGYRGAIVGAKGTGKTTLIEELSSRLTFRNIQCAILRLADDGRKTNLHRVRHWLEETPTNCILLLDSAGQLTWWDWKRFETQSLKYRGLMITAHRPGRLPTLMECCPSLCKFIEFVDELAPEHTLTRLTLKKVFERHRGNVRDCFRLLYDEYDQS